MKGGEGVKLETPVFLLWYNFHKKKKSVKKRNSGIKDLIFNNILSFINILFSDISNSIH